MNRRALQHLPAFPAHPHSSRPPASPWPAPSTRQTATAGARAGARRGRRSIHEYRLCWLTSSLAATSAKGLPGEPVRGSGGKALPRGGGRTGGPPLCHVREKSLGPVRKRERELLDVLQGRTIPLRQAA